MNLMDKRTEWLEEFSAIRNSQERFAAVIRKGQGTPALPSEFKTDAYRVEGCLAKLWFLPEFRDGKCFFRADSDSAIVKGIASMLCDFYSDAAPAEILAMDPSFLEKGGITQHLTPNRRNSLARVWEMIKHFAESHAHA
jgi:cysteine desulfuration protein SufE